MLDYLKVLLLMLVTVMSCRRWQPIVTQMILNYLSMIFLRLGILDRKY